MNGKLNIALIYGSTREGRFCDTVARWVESQVRDNAAFSLEVIDPARRTPNASLVRGAAGEPDSFKDSLAAADAFIVVTPEYNHGYPAPLKALIDSMYEPWHGKPVAFVSYGGMSGGLRAVEQLRQVFAELHAVSIRDSVSFPNVWEQFGATGELLQPARYAKSMTGMLAHLAWWASNLRIARRAAPYQNITA